MKISENFEKKQIKSFSLNFDKKLIRHIEKLKSPDKRIKNAMIYLFYPPDLDKNEIIELTLFYNLLCPFFSY